MNWPRFYNLIFSFCLGAGVMFAQVCNVVCIAASCPKEKKVVTTETPDTASHCQHSEPSDPKPDDDSHSCQTHDLIVLLAASESPANAIAHVDWQPIALLPAWIEFQFSPQPMAQVRLSALRSPPRRPQRQILRI